MKSAEPSRNGRPWTKNFSESVGARWPRRRLLKAFSAAGVSSGIFIRALMALGAEKAQVTEEMIHQAEWISGLKFTDARRKLMLEGVNDALTGYAKIREVPLDNGVPPVLVFDPRLPGSVPGSSSSAAKLAKTATTKSPGHRAGTTHRPKSEDDLPFLPVSELSTLVRTRQVSSMELTRLYLDRLRRFDPLLLCVITYTDDLALKQAEKADREIAAGHYRGPLHGIPWGAKDLLAVPGYRTTWGARPYENQTRSEKAAVVARLEEAGAVLLAKLSLGELAMDDVWFGGQTRNPWNTKQGSSGSSAGSAAATAAGLVGFSLGTETWGSIVSPCTRCGSTGLRPTFGRVSRYGAMALAWSMDKIGPICRSVEDCALVFRAIHGTQGGTGKLDPAAVDRPFVWPYSGDVKKLRLGYVEALFEEDRTKNAGKDENKERLKEWQEIDRRGLEKLRQIGFKLVPIQLPDRYPIDPLALILTAEAATAFDELTRSGRDDLLVRQDVEAWPNLFQQGQMIPAVEYIRANRIRALLVEAMQKLMSEVDVYVSPSEVGSNLLLTNLTGNPCVVVPDGFYSGDGTPTSITFMGKLYGETEVLAVANAYQQATDFHLKRPPLQAQPKKA
jgi:Asp-tRNA(Asn)/Glu-tRNA(Gln) amidotransferase A subunit family amidase